MKLQQLSVVTVVSLLQLQAHAKDASVHSRRRMHNVVRSNDYYGDTAQAEAPAYDQGTWEAPPEMKHDAPTEAWTDQSYDAHTTAAYETTWSQATTPPATTTTHETYAPTYTPQYGSGYEAWADEYEGCVQKCEAIKTKALVPDAAKATGKAKGSVAASAAYTTASAAAVAAAPVGSGTPLVAANNREIIVAPQKGDLRFVPIAINGVKPGEKIHFVWGAGPHTVTQSSAFSICNATLDSNAFKGSGRQNASFTFDIEVKTDDPTWIFCGVLDHCQKGMFAVINPVKAAKTKDSVGYAMESLAKKDAEFAAKWNATDAATKPWPEVQTWGSVSQWPEDERTSAWEQVLATREFYAKNPTLLSTPPSTASTGGSPSNAVGEVAAVPTSTDAASAANAASGEDNALSGGAGHYVSWSVGPVIVAVTSAILLSL